MINLTKMNQKELTLETLAHEYELWQHKYGQGRNEQDLRFGQYIHCYFNVNALFPQADSGTDGFGAEKAADGYKILSEELSLDWSMADGKLDKFLPDNSEIQDEFYETKETIEMQVFLNDYCTDEERMESYFPEGGTTYGFAQYLANQNK